MPKIKIFFIAFIFSSFIGSVAFAETTEQPDSRDAFSLKDPLSPINKPIFAFNLYFDRFLMRPINKAYDVLPITVRIAADNFFTNLAEPLNIIEGTLQADPQVAFTSLSRFLMNTTIGFGGIYDYAETQGLEFQNQSGGKTLAIWGLPTGAYVVLPFLGPSTVRGAGGEAIDWFIDPTGYVLNTPQQMAQVAGDAITNSDENRSVIDQLYYESLSPYEATRATFMQHEGIINYAAINYTND